MLRLLPRFSTAILAAAIAVLAAGRSFADDAKNTALPGVDSTYSIVTPAPEPAEPSADASGTKKVGKWELTVSGYVWVQVGASSPVDGR